ncbi:phage holin family protein [Blastococcus sp. MG754426]|uniref:phage holin family protein n=1 Tax=unclassified Blastococcus TaxID=2619396 RepID=UPI001EEFB95F|nr:MULTISPECIES: phage holin family protein [unclassified Blastococcus]MCF6508694.1 phage holin family protein [Blastococcus sp. MG754426]MCF6513277.1 phage holin family protein [Blastococcus sp. MG754427]MCF6736757.1 phage holin family protein [Blastococcus sp. KM273129]
MSSPYSGATPAGSQGYAEPTAQNYAADYPEGQQHYSGDMGTPTTESGHPDVEGVSVGALIGEVTKDLSTLMRQELELAKAELKTEAKKAGQGAGMFGAAGFAGYMVLMFLSFALWWALENVMDAGLAALIVAVLWGVVGAVAYVMGRKKFQQVNPKPERTVDTLQQVPGAMKPH